MVGISFFFFLRRLFCSKLKSCKRISWVAPFFRALEFGKLDTSLFLGNDQTEKFYLTNMVVWGITEKWM